MWRLRRTGDLAEVDLGKFYCIFKHCTGLSFRLKTILNVLDQQNCLISLNKKQSVLQEVVDK